MWEGVLKFPLEEISLILNWSDAGQYSNFLFVLYWTRKLYFCSDLKPHIPIWNKVRIIESIKKSTAWFPNSQQTKQTLQSQHNYFVISLAGYLSERSLWETWPQWCCRNIRLWKAQMDADITWWLGFDCDDHMAAVWVWHPLSSLCEWTDKSVHVEDWCLEPMVNPQGQCWQEETINNT